MNLQRAAAARLAEHLQARAAELLGKTLEVSADPEDAQTCPALAMVHSQMEFMPFQEDSVHVTATLPDKELVEVGVWSGSLELRIFASTPAEREEVEQDVLDAFMAREGAPGIIVLQLPPVRIGTLLVTGYRPSIAFMLDRGTWRDEMAFAHRRFTFLDVSMNVPALALRSDRYAEDVVLAITEDPAAEEETALVVEAGAERRQINEDGTITTL